MAMISTTPRFRLQEMGLSAAEIQAILMLEKAVSKRALAKDSTLPKNLFWGIEDYTLCSEEAPGKKKISLTYPLAMIDQAKPNAKVRGLIVYGFQRIRTNDLVRTYSCTISHLIVHPADRRQGIATELVNAVIKFYTAYQLQLIKPTPERYKYKLAPWIEVIVPESMLDLQLFLQKSGFAASRYFLKDHFGPGQAGYVMSRQVAFPALRGKKK